MPNTALGIVEFPTDDPKIIIRQGYTSKVLANLLNIRQTEVRLFLSGQLPTGRTQDLREQMLKIGIPLLAS